MKVSGLFYNAKTFKDVLAGTVIFEEGASGTEMFGVVEGEVEVRLPNGAVRRLGPNTSDFRCLGLLVCAASRVLYLFLSLFSWRRCRFAGMGGARVSRRAWRAVPRSAAPAGGAVL